MLPQQYINLLEREGLALSDIGVNETALARSSALAAIQALSQSNVGILGGDVYLLVDGELVVTYDNWYCDDESYPDHSTFVRESCKKAQKYVEQYKEPPHGTVLFTLVVAEEVEARGQAV